MEKTDENPGGIKIIELENNFYSNNNNLNSSDKIIPKYKKNSHSYNTLSNNTTNSINDFQNNTSYEKNKLNNIKPNKCKIIICLIILFILVVIGIIAISDYYKINKERLKIFSKGRKYIDICLTGELLHKNINYNFTNIKVSAIIPVYNCEKYIKNVLRSIQNQNMVEIEIILVNDFSKDKSLEIITELQKEDSRIKIINNLKNRGTLYSRCIGVLESKGKYIFPLDNDDMFLDSDVFDTIVSEAENNEYDIVGFKSLQADSYYTKPTSMKEGCHTFNTNFTVYQPKLSLFGISKNGNINIYDIHIWSKCIKNSVYKKALQKLGEDKYTQFIINSEDIIMVYTLFNVAKSYRYITKYGIYRYNRKNSGNTIMNHDHRIYVQIFLMDLIIDFTRNKSKEKRFAVYKALQIRKNRSFKNLSDKNLKFLNSVLNKIFSCEYINNKDKTLLKELYKDYIK